MESWRKNEATRPEHRTFEAKDFYLHFNFREVKSSETEERLPTRVDNLSSPIQTIKVGFAKKSSCLLFHHLNIYNLVIYMNLEYIHAISKSWYVSQLYQGIIDPTCY